MIVSNGDGPPNFTLQLPAGRLPRPGLKAPLLILEPRRHAARRRANVKCGRRRAALPHARGASPQLSVRTLDGPELLARAGTCNAWRRAPQS